MRALLAACVLVAVACTSAAGKANQSASAPRTASPSASPSPRAVQASGGVVEYSVPDPISQGASCFGCGQASLGGIVAGPDGNIWFVDGGHYKVGRITASGAVTEFDLPAVVGGPGGITAGPDGNIWVTTNALGQGRPDWIVRVSPDGAVAQFQAGTGSGDSGTGPEGITSGPDGNLWFTEFWSNRIGRMTPRGALTEFPIPTPDSAPRGIVSGPDGNLWFLESGFNHTAVARISTGGAVTEYPLGGSANDQLQPYAITAGPDGNLWFAQTHPSATQGEVGRITPGGLVNLFPLSTGSRPLGVAKGPDGNMWITDPGANTIVRMSPTGTIRQFALPRPNSQPVGIAAGSDGHMWFTEGNRIGSIGTTVPEATLSPRILRFAAAETHSVNVTNGGDAALNIASASLVGPDHDQFIAVRDDCSGRSLAVRGTCRVEVAFKASAPPGIRAARLVITDNATGSPHSVSLVAELPDCKLPVFMSSASKTQGGFLSLRDGGVVDDPNAVFVNGGTLSHSQAAPILNGQLPAFYDRAAGRWVPTGIGAMSPDGRRYAYMDYSHPYDFHLHVVEVATARDQLLTLPNGPWSVAGFTSDGIYIHQTYEGVGLGLWLVNPDSGAVRQLFSDAAVDLVSGQVAWIEARDKTDPLPEPPGIGGANNVIMSRNLKTGITTKWFYRSGASVRATAATSDSVVVSGYDSRGTFTWVLVGPGQVVPITVPGSGDSIPSTSGLVADSNGWWLGSLDGIYLWTPRTGTVLVSESPTAPAGTCA